MQQNLGRQFNNVNFFKLKTESSSENNLEIGAKIYESAQQNIASNTLTQISLPLTEYNNGCLLPGNNTIVIITPGRYLINASATYNPVRAGAPTEFNFSLFANYPTQQLAAFRTSNFNITLAASALISDVFTLEVGDIISLYVTFSNDIAAIGGPYGNNLITSLAIHKL